MAKGFDSWAEELMGGNNPFSKHPARDCLDAIESIRRSAGKIEEAEKEEDTKNDD